MSVLIVTDNPETWPLDIPGVGVVSARKYLTDPSYADERGLKVFNLCKSHRYQALGYYVSLLAEARGHKPLPSVTTIQDLKSLSMIRFAAEDLEDVIQPSLSHIQSTSFTLSVYFGQNMAKRYDRLCKALFNLFPTPLLRAQFSYEDGRWHLEGLEAVAAGEIPDLHRSFVEWAAGEYFSGRKKIRGKPQEKGYDLAILYNDELADKPSTMTSIRHFQKAAKIVGFNVEMLDRDDYGKIAEFDALFIRETTAVNHHTYRFARRAAAEGLAVIDDPTSILRCSNKVYLHELFESNDIPCPKTLVVHRENKHEVKDKLGIPCVLKRPDSSFSQGVIKVTDPDKLDDELDLFLEKSDLVIAQEFLPSAFDWRIGVLDRKALFACRYHMAKGHWQIVSSGKKGEKDYGKTEAVPLDLVPKKVLNTAVRAANLIGDGLYGVDLKQIDQSVYMIEINDNPNVDHGYEDVILGEGLFITIMQSLMDRVKRIKEGKVTS
jgi:glutathione synthase/RimK-type ligase-like ATP-grasp enzyme